MDIRRELLGLEGRVVGAGYRISAVLAEAGVTRQTWANWKSGRSMPMLEKWLSVQRVAEDMIAAPNLDIPPKPSDRPDEAA